MARATDLPSDLADRLPAGQRAQLEGLAALAGLDQEIAILRFMIRELLAAGEYRETRQQIAALCRALTVQLRLDGGDSGHELGDALLTELTARESSAPAAPDAD